MRVAIVTDAWHPQVNGVVRTIDATRAELRRLGHEIEVFGPDRFGTLPCPTYPDIRLSIMPGRRLASLLSAFLPAAVHIATEGPLGSAARGFCRRRGLPFTTAYHTRFPEYLGARFGVPVAWTYAALRRFHAPATAVMVSTPSVRDALAGRGFANLRPWTRGVDTSLFRPRSDPTPASEDGRPVFLYVGRLAVEKNLDAFLSLDLPGHRWVVGDGPEFERLRARYPDARFFGRRQGEALATLYRAADVFVFPSRTDTFGLVLLEALASGLPVAAFPVPGPLDVIGDAPVGVLDHDLRAAALRALQVEPAACRAQAARFSWRASAEMFLANLAPYDPMPTPCGAQPPGSPAATQA
ncbi:MAG: glycosyltransferase family 1 protein [Rhodospirillales bacterium]|nr:MAG: glycosyltransferase family 1 protein [Rhodospirillales bacterium]